MERSRLAVCGQVGLQLPTTDERRSPSVNTGRDVTRWSRAVKQSRYGTLRAPGVNCFQRSKVKCLLMGFLRDSGCIQWSSANSIPKQGYSFCSEDLSLDPRFGSHNGLSIDMQISVQLYINSYVLTLFT